MKKIFRGLLPKGKAAFSSGTGARFARIGLFLMVSGLMFALTAYIISTDSGSIKNIPVAQAQSSCNVPAGGLNSLSVTDQKVLNCVLRMRKKLTKQNAYIDLTTIGQKQYMTDFKYACAKKQAINLYCPDNPVSQYNIMMEEAVDNLLYYQTGNFLVNSWFVYENSTVPYFMGGVEPDPSTLADTAVICGIAADFGTNPGGTGWSNHLPKTGDNETAIWCAQNNGNVDAVCSIVNQQGYDICV